MYIKDAHYHDYATKSLLTFLGGWGGGHMLSSRSNEICSTWICALIKKKQEHFLGPKTVTETKEFSESYFNCPSITLT